MKREEFISFLNSSGCAYRLDEPMSLHTTFKIGGKADYFITPADIPSLKGVVEACIAAGIPCLIMGNGSNMLVSDSGIKKAVISLAGMNEEITVKNNIIKAGAGVTLTRLCRLAYENSLTGLEFAFGIPGTLGGGIYMNAGAYGGEIKDVLVSCTCLVPGGEIVTLQAHELDLSYRHSVFHSNNAIILSGEFRLEKGEKSAIKSKMDDLLSRRRSKQPVEYPSAGSVFKRPPGYFAGTLIEQSGLKGLCVGGAQVSLKHAGFIINTGGATASDVVRLIEIIKNTVFIKTGIMLESEIRIFS